LKEWNMLHLIYQCKYSLREGWLGLGASGSISTFRSRQAYRRVWDILQTLRPFVPINLFRMVMINLLQSA
jgi:hypothetical protein